MKSNSGSHKFLNYSNLIHKIEEYQNICILKALSIAKEGERFLYSLSFT